MKAITDLKPYPVMKDSGVEWLSEIPKHWDVRRLRYLSRVPIRNGVGESAQEFRSDWPRYIRITDIAGTRKLKESNPASLPPEFMKKAPLEYGDILLAAVGATYGKTYLHSAATYSACFAGYLVKWSPSEEIIPGWASYWTESNAYWKQVHSGMVMSTIENFSASKFRRLYLALPPRAEQILMVRYLDYVGQRVRRVVETKRKLIALLDELKQATIHRAVTRGLNPSAPMKNTGLQWCPQVPLHWQLMRNREILKQRRNIVGEKHSQYTLLSLTKEGVVIRDLSDNKGKFSSDMGTSQKVHQGDLVMCLFDVPETPRTIGISNHNGMITSAYTVFQPKDSWQGRWLERFYIAMDDWKLLSPLYSGLRNTIPRKRFLRTKTPIPPVSEAIMIQEHLINVCNNIDIVSARTTREIELLEELRTRLVSDVVTGKLDVREVAADLPEIDPLEVDLDDLDSDLEEIEV